MEGMLTDEQVQFAQILDRFVKQEYGGRTGPHGLDRGRLERLAELGSLSLAVPEEMGGFGGPVERMLVMQYLAPGLPAEPILASGIHAAGILAAALPGGAAAELLPGLMDGSLIVTVADQEEGSRYRTDLVETRARPDAGGWIVDGEKHLVAFAAEADVLIVSARDTQSMELGLYRIDSLASGLHVTARPGVDGLPRGDVRLAGCRAAARIADRDVADMLVAAADQAEAAQVAEMVGLMDALIRETISYLQTRRQFGTEIGRFQALQHRLADMWIHCEEVRSVALAAALSCDAAPDVRARTVSMAKMLACDAARLVANEAVQMHGGIGVTDELIVGHWFKRLLALRASLGDRRYHMSRLLDRAGPQTRSPLAEPA